MSAATRRRRWFGRGVSRRLACAGALAAAGWLGSCGRDAGGRASAGSGAERIVVYTSIDGGAARRALDAFESETGVRVELRAGDPAALVERIESERQAPRADVVWIDDLYEATRLDERGLLEPAPPAGEGAGERAPAWRPVGARARVLAYNTKRLRQQDAPREVIELSAPRFANRLIMARPTTGTSRWQMATLVTIWGADTTRWWMEQVRNNGLRLAQNEADVVAMIARGDVDVGLTDAGLVEAARRAGKPIACFPAKIDGTYARRPVAGRILLVPSAAGVVAGAPHGAMAQRLVDFLTGERGARLLSAQGEGAGAGASGDEAPIDIPAGEVASHVDEASAACAEVWR